MNDLKANWFTVNDSAILNELAPTGYNTLYHCPRSGRRDGGTALLVRNGYVTSKISCIEKSSFEVSEWLVDDRSTQLRIVIIYRPPSSPVHPVSSSTFFAEFSDYLESVVMSSEPLVLLGDFNIHVDVPTHMDAIQFRDLLDSMGLQQHVKRPTHIHGHTLDLLITRQSDVIIAKEPEIERYFSDHAVVYVILRQLCLPLKSPTLSPGNSKELTSNSFWKIFVIPAYVVTLLILLMNLWNATIIL